MDFEMFAPVIYINKQNINKQTVFTNVLLVHKTCRIGFVSVHTYVNYFD